VHNSGITDKNIPSAKKKGFDFSIYMTFQNLSPLYEQSLYIPGGSLVPDYLSKKMNAAYYVRASVRDLASGETGSAYQFLEIPNLKEPRLALSSIFIINRDEDLSRIKSGDSSDLQTKQFFDPDALRRSPALRSFLPGEGFGYVVMVYNAKSKKIKEPRLESQIVLYKDGEEYLRTEMEDVDTPETGIFEMIPVIKRLNVEPNMAPGDYVMQFMVRDKEYEKERRGAAQAIDFQIRQETK
jgi:hypothetical protein